MVLAVNTTRAHRHKHGEVSAAQIARVAGRLKASSSGKLRIVVTHQPINVPSGTDEKNLLRGYAEAARAWASAGADLVLGGHIHLPFVKAMKDLPRPLWVVQAGTAVSQRVRPGAKANSVNLVRYDTASDPGACVVERWDHDAARDRFQLADRTRIVLHR
jgi:3',5'-cyclic AMP phosphodiesterase CpdA